jgi:hypothetical protein
MAFLKKKLFFFFFFFFFYGFNLHAAHAEPHSSGGEAKTTTTCSSQSSFCALVGLVSVACVIQSYRKGVDEVGRQLYRVIK